MANVIQPRVLQEMTTISSQPTPAHCLRVRAGEALMLEPRARHLWYQMPCWLFFQVCLWCSLLPPTSLFLNFDFGICQIQAWQGSSEWCPAQATFWVARQFFQEAEAGPHTSGEGKSTKGSPETGCQGQSQGEGSCSSKVVWEAI